MFKVYSDIRALIQASFVMKSQLVFQDSAQAYSLPSYPTKSDTSFVKHRLATFRDAGFTQFIAAQGGDLFFFSKHTQKYWAKTCFDLLNVNTNKLFVGQPFHLVSPSPLPFLVGISFFFVAFTIIYGVRADGAHFGFHWVWPFVLVALIFS